MSSISDLEIGSIEQSIALPVLQHVSCLLTVMAEPRMSQEYKWLYSLAVVSDFGMTIH
jgi:hypothetical protein